jgi:hypothetical protein
MVVMCLKKVTDCALCLGNFVIIIICSGIFIAKHYKLPEVANISETYTAIALALLVFVNFVYCMIYKIVCKVN